MEKKKKILLLSDHPLATSGVGTQARYLVQGLVATGKYSFICFGGAIRHENYNQVTISKDFIIKPTDGFGTREMIRSVLIQEKPDAIMLFTDPRFFIWLWEMEDEIHQVCPILYNHLWDNPPAPEFNKVLYESNDLINCINYPTYEFCKEWYPDKTNFIPHAVPKDIFFKLDDNKIKANRKVLLGNRPDDTFIAAWVNRNARRKMPGDVLQSWKIFLDELQKKYSHRNALLVMHTDPFDQEGPNLVAVVKNLGIENNVIFSKDRHDFDYMNKLYNNADVTITRSCFTAGTKVATKQGYKPIETIKNGDFVMTHRGRWRQVVDLIQSPISDKKMKKFNVNGSDPFECTDDHEIFSIKNNDLPKDFSFNIHGRVCLDYVSKKKAKDLEVGDYIVSFSAKNNTNSKMKVEFDLYEHLSKNTFLRNGIETKTYQIENGRIISNIFKKIDHGPQKILLDEDLAYVLGAWASSGNSNSFGITFNKGNSSRIETFIERAQKAFPGTLWTSNEASKHIVVSVKNAGVISSFFTENCGFYSDGKRIPDDIMTSSNEIKRAYIEGYLSAGGYMSAYSRQNDKINTIRTISSNLAYNLRQLLVDLGYSPSLHHDDDSSEYSKNVNTWTLEWRSDTGEDNINSMSWNVGDGIIVSRILDISERISNDEIVYDMTVDEDHSYMIESVTVSNCNEGFGLSLLESMMTATPIIALKTGGTTRQVIDHRDGSENGIALDPEVRSLVGSQLVPYIYEDYVSHETFANAIMKMYEFGDEKRKELGRKAQEYAHYEFSMENLISKWDSSIESTLERWEKEDLKRKQWSITEL